MKKASVRQLLSIEPLPFPLPSRLPRRAVGAKPTCPGLPWRDLQFRGIFLEMFFDRSVAQWRDLRFPYTSQLERDPSRHLQQSRSIQVSSDIAELGISHHSVRAAKLNTIEQVE